MSATRILSFPFFLLPAFLTAQQPKLMLPVGHTSAVTSTSFSPDGKKIATSSEDGTAKIWDIETGNLLADLKEHTDWVLAVSYSPDGRKIVTASWDHTARIWDTKTLRRLAVLKGHTSFLISASFSPDGKKILTASNDGTAKIWDAETGVQLVDLIGHTRNLNCATFSPDGNKIATAAWENTAKIWDAVTGNLLVNLNGHTNTIESLSFSPDGKKIATASRDSTARVWDTKTGKPLMDLKGHTYIVNIVSFSPDGKKIATGSWDSTARLWNAETGKLLMNLKGHTSSLESISFSPDGKKIATGSWDSTARLWDVETGKLLAELNGHARSFKEVSFSPDGKKIVGGSIDGIVKIWDSKTHAPLTDLTGHARKIQYASFSPDDKKIVSVSDDGTAVILDVESGRMIANLNGHTKWINAASFSPDGKKIVTASLDKTAKVWDPETGKLLLDFKEHTDGIRLASFSPDGKKILTAALDNTTKIWDPGTGKLMADLKGHTNRVNAASFSPNGKRILTSDLDGITKIWDAESGNLLFDLKKHTGIVNSSSFSPDGKKILTASFDGTAKIWDAGTGNLLIDLNDHTSWVVFASFSPEGKKVVTACKDKIAKVWDAETGKHLTDLTGHTDDLYSASFSPDGKKIVTNSYDKTARIWNTADFSLLYTIKSSAELVIDSRNRALSVGNSEAQLFDLNTGKAVYSFLALDNTDYLLYDSVGRYDGTGNARKFLYFTCGTEIVELDQVKDQLWVPDLAGRIMKGETINAKTLGDLNICGLTPEVENKNDGISYNFKITPRRGGLGETVLYVNGIEASRYKPTQLIKAGLSYELKVKKEELGKFFIAGQENQVSIKAYTSDNTISSRGVKINDKSANQPVIPPNLYAVMVGVSDYKGDELDLKYAAKDATDISNAIAVSARKLLNADGKEHVFMYNLTTAADRYQLPEKNSIKKTFEEIGKKATANDILLIFFAGHGVMEGEKKQFYFLTADASGTSATAAANEVGISTSELTEWMKPQNIKAQKRILILDACNSGQAINDFVKIGTGDQQYIAARNDEKIQQIKAIDKLNEKSGLFILSASSSSQSAYEMGRYSQGLLTYSLLKAIKQQPDILEDGKYLNVSRWFNAAEKTVTELAKESGARQNPQIVTNTNFNIGVVDEEVLTKIVLPNEKPLFARSNFQNAETRTDNLKLRSLVDKELNGLSSRGPEAPISYNPAYEGSNAYSLSGDYKITGQTVVVTVIFLKGEEKKNQFVITGTADKINELAASIVEKTAATFK